MASQRVDGAGRNLEAVLRSDKGYQEYREMFIQEPGDVRVNDERGHVSLAEYLEKLIALLYALRTIVDADNLNTLLEWTVCCWRAHLRGQGDQEFF